MCKEDVLKVLDRTAHDLRFVVQMTYDSTKALDTYNLTDQERTALVSGGIPWIEANFGELDGVMSAWTRSMHLVI